MSPNDRPRPASQQFGQSASDTGMPEPLTENCLVQLFKDTDPFKKGPFKIGPYIFNSENEYHDHACRMAAALGIYDMQIQTLKHPDGPRGWRYNFSNAQDQRRFNLCVNGDDTGTFQSVYVMHDASPTEISNWIDATKTFLHDQNVKNFYYTIEKDVEVVFGFSRKSDHYILAQAIDAGIIEKIAFGTKRQNVVSPTPPTLRS